MTVEEQRENVDKLSTEAVTFTVILLEPTNMSVQHIFSCLVQVF